MVRTKTPPPLPEKSAKLKTKTSSLTSDNSSGSPKTKKAKSKGDETRPKVKSHATKVEEPLRVDPPTKPKTKKGTLTRSESHDDSDNESVPMIVDSDDGEVKQVKPPATSVVSDARKDKLRRLEAAKLRKAAKEKELQERIAVERAEAGRISTIQWLEKQQVRKFMKERSIPVDDQVQPDPEQLRQNNEYHQAGIFELPSEANLDKLPPGEAYSKFIHDFFKEEYRDMTEGAKNRLGEEGAREARITSARKNKSKWLASMADDDGLDTQQVLSLFDLDRFGADSPIIQYHIQLVSREHEVMNSPRPRRLNKKTRAMTIPDTPRTTYGSKLITLPATRWTTNATMHARRG